MVAIAVNVIALNILEHQIGLATGRYSRVNELRDVGMRQAAENAPFASEPLFAAFPHQGHIKNLDRHAAFKTPVIPLSQPDRAHTPVADLRYERISTKVLSRQGNFARQFRRRGVEKAFLREQAML